MIACADRDESSGNLDVLRGRFAAILHKVVLNSLIFVEGGEPRTLDGRDMDEHVLIADGRLDEPKTLGRVEPLDGTLRHCVSPGLDEKKTRPRFPRATPQTGFGVSAQ